jgi:hypothetical protein
MQQPGGGTGKRRSATDARWQRFGADLAACLGALERDEFLIVSHRQVNHYIQFAAQGPEGMRAEASSNTYIEPPEACLSVEDYQHMEELGWNRANNLPPELNSPDDVPGGSPNFYIDLDHPVDMSTLAELTITTFRQVYRVQSPLRLQYRAFHELGDEIRFPTLRLRRDPAASAAWWVPPAG